MASVTVVSAGQELAVVASLTVPAQQHLAAAHVPMWRLSVCNWTKSSREAPAFCISSWLAGHMHLFSSCMLTAPRCCVATSAGVWRAQLQDARARPAARLADQLGHVYPYNYPLDTFREAAVVAGPATKHCCRRISVSHTRVDSFAVVWRGLRVARKQQVVYANPYGNMQLRQYAAVTLSMCTQAVG